jgi:hypothetical protein
MITPDDKKLVRKMARDSFGPIIDLSETEKSKLRKALRESHNVSLSECVVAARENGIDADTRQLLKLRNEILQERMGEMLQAQSHKTN